VRTISNSEPPANRIACRVGRSQDYLLFNLVSFGDASARTAMCRAGITHAMLIEEVLSGVKIIFILRQTVVVGFNTLEDPILPIPVATTAPPTCPHPAIPSPALDCTSPAPSDCASVASPSPAPSDPASVPSPPFDCASSVLSSPLVSSPGYFFPQYSSPHVKPFLCGQGHF